MLTRAVVAPKLYNNHATFAFTKHAATPHALLYHLSPKSPFEQRLAHAAACPAQNSSFSADRGIIGPNVPGRFSGSVLDEASDDAAKLLSSLLVRVKTRKKRIEGMRASPLLQEHLSHPGKVVKLVDALDRSGSPARIYHVLLFARAFGCRPKQNMYEFAAHRMAERGLWSLVLDVVRLGKIHTKSTTVRLLNWRARACVELEDFATLSRVPHEFKHYGLRPNRRTYHLIISGFLRNRDMPAVRDAFKRMQEDGIPIEASTHALIAVNHRSFGHSSDIQDQAIRHLGNVPPSTATSVLNNLILVHLDANDMAAVQELLCLFDERARPISSAIATVYSIDASSDSSLLCFPPFQAVAPNAVTFAMFISRMAAHMPDIALGLVNKMAEGGIQPDTSTVVALVRAYFAMGNDAAAITLVQSMCNTARVDPGNFSSLFRETRAGPIRSLIDTQGIPLTVRVFNALMKGVLYSRGLDSLIPVLRIMHAQGISPSSATLQILVTYLSRVEHARPPSLFRTLRALSSTSIRPSLKHLHTIFSAILRHERYLRYGSGWNASAAHFTSRHTPGKRPVSSDRFTSTQQAIDATAGIILPTTPSYRALERPLKQSLTSRGVRGDAPMFALRLSLDAAIGTEMDTAKELFQMLLHRGIRPNAHHYAALMEGYVRSGNFKSATDVLNSCLAIGIKPNAVMFTILISGYAREGKPELAVRTFQEMVAADIKPDIASIDAVASSFFVVGAYGTASQTLKTLWPYIQPFPEELRNAPLKQLAMHLRSLQEDRKLGTPKTLSKEERITLYGKLSGIVRSFRRIRSIRGKHGC